MLAIPEAMAGKQVFLYYPSISGDGDLVLLPPNHVYDVRKDRVLGEYGGNENAFASISGNGRLVAYSETRDGGDRHIYLDDILGKTSIDCAAINSQADDALPALNGDGRALALSSNRSGGKGGYDIYLFRFVDQ